MTLKEEFLSLNENYRALIMTGNNYLLSLIPFAKDEFNLQINKQGQDNFIEFDLFHTLIEIRIQIPPGGIKDGNGELVTHINKGEEVKNLTLSFDLTEEITLPDSPLTLQNFPRIYFKKLLDIIIKEKIRF